MRLPLRLADRHDWVKVFDPRGGALFVETVDPPPAGTPVSVDLVLESCGPRVILSGDVLWSREAEDATPRDPPGCAVGLAASEREKVNFLNGYIRGGLIDRRERRRLPLRLKVTYGGLSGPLETITRDINEEGMFILADTPLPEKTLLHFIVLLPARVRDAGPPQGFVELKGVVSHAVESPEGDEVPGMGVRFLLDDPPRAAEIQRLVDALERAFLAGALPEEVIS